jgi:nicotinamidase-related amidase
VNGCASGPQGRSRIYQRAEHFGKRKDQPWLHSLFKGRFDKESGKLTFTKNYDGTSGIAHDVEYSGSLSGNKKKINGTWKIAADWGGDFSQSLDNPHFQGKMIARHPHTREGANSMRGRTTSKAALPLPEFFARESRRKADQVWPVPYQVRADQAEKWAKQHGLLSAAQDRFRICLLAVDCQNTFCLPDFELPVAGAVNDSVRLCEFIYRNLGVITEIDPTLDTHTAMQIFHTVFLINDAGEHPAPLTVISFDDVARGKWKVNPAVADNLAGDYQALQQHLLHYSRQLSDGGKYMLMIWPYHAMHGGIGHSLVAIVEEACFFHNMARQSQTGFEIKGNNPLTEHYSVLRPEVLDDARGAPIAQKNERLIKKLLNFDAVIIAGQAKSHCVAWTVDDLLTEIRARDDQLAKKIYLLEDCTSPVVVPGVVDFTKQAHEAFRRFADAGMNVVRSTDAIDSWRGISL